MRTFLYVSVSVLVLGTFAAPTAKVLGVWDGTPYDPEETLDPECSPTDPSCSVSRTGPIEAESITVGGETITSFSGTGLSVDGGQLQLDASGAWTGVFDGHEGSYYIANSFSTTSANYWRTQHDFFATSSVEAIIASTPGLGFSTSSTNSWLTTKTTDDITEGTNRYYTDARVNALLLASSSIAKTDGLQAWTGTQIFAATALTVTGLSNGCVELVSGQLTTNGSNCGSGSGGILSLNGLTSGGQSFATSSDSNISITITSSGATHTFTPVWNGTLSSARGGTGTSSVTPGALLLGSAGNTWTQMATSSLGLPTFDTLTGYLPIGSWYSTTTDAIAEGTTNQYYADARVATFLDVIAKGYFFATSSADYWREQQDFFSTTSVSSLVNALDTTFSTTSANYWRTQQDFLSTSSIQALITLEPDDSFSTTSANYWQTNRDFFSTTSAHYFIDSVPGLSFSTSSVVYWFTQQSTSNLAEGSNLYFTLNRVAAVLAGTSTDALTEGIGNRYYTDTRARNALSSSVPGLTYTSGAGVFSLASGYAVPLIASTSEWSTAYLHRITGVSAPFMLTNNSLGLSAGYSVPLTASTSEWANFFQLPSMRISAGTNLSWSGLTLNGPTNATIRSLFSASSPLSFDTSTGTFTLSTVGVTQGGTGTTSFGQGWLYSSGDSSPLVASTSPTVTYLVATSTSQASTFAYRVGIGISPNTTLHVNGDVTLETIKNCGSLQALGTNATGRVLCVTLSLSDERLKEDIQPLQEREGLALINTLTPVSYRWKDPNVYGGTDALQYGFIAQQAAEVVPNLVGGGMATELTPEGSKYFNYLGVIAPLIKAVQEISTTIANLKENVTTRTLCLEDICLTKEELRTLLESVQEEPPSPIHTDEASSNVPLPDESFEDKVEEEVSTTNDMIEEFPVETQSLE